MWCARYACGASLLVIFLSLLDGCFAKQCTEYYHCTHACYTQTTYTSACGWLWLQRCRRYRSTANTCTQSCSRQICCAGFIGKGCNTPVCYGDTSCPNGGKCLEPNNCQCATGFKKPRCDDIDECANNNGGCKHRCVNTNGSFRCECRSGYQLASDKASCIEINECAKNKGGCEHTCTNTPGSFRCGCIKGYSINRDKRTCADIDECVTGTSGCGQTCTNAVGSYACSCTKGYTLAHDEHKCEDMDECKNGLSKCEQICVNTPGSYKCTCQAGYKLNHDGRTCADIDECVTNTNGCEDYCTNTIGSFTCSCKTGYALDQDGKTCNDIDECLVDDDKCAQICINTQGSYICKCHTGYLLQGDRQSCTDIDECKNDVSNCEQSCVNTPGSYNCTCHTGYQLNQDGRTCADIDDCLSADCKHGGTCVDGLTSYTCLCLAAFTGHFCEIDVNECDFLNGGCEDRCTNDIGSYSCGCTGNGTLNTDGKSCSGGTKRRDVFRRHKIARKFLPRGCSEIVLTKCKDGQDITIFLSSTSGWYTLKSNRQTVYTYGIVFAEVNSVAVPVSIPGVEVNMADGSFQIKLGARVYPVSGGEPVGQTRTKDCWQFDVTSQDVFDFVESSSFLKSYFYSLVESLPDWIELKLTNESVLDVQGLKTELTYGRDIESVGWCKGAPVLDDHLYSVFLFDTSFSVSVYTHSLAIPKPLNHKKFCLIVDLCSSIGGSVFLLIPEESQSQFGDLDVFRKLYEQSKVRIIPRGVGLSLVRGVNVHQKTTSLTLWNGDHIFRYPASALKRAGELWEVHRFNGEKKMLTAMFIDEWDALFTLRLDVTPILKFKLFGNNYTLQFPQLANFQQNVYMSVGGEKPRKMCGDTSNPPGSFLSTTLRGNPFINVPILKDWFVEGEHTLYVSLITEPQFLMREDLKTEINEDIVQINRQTKHLKQLLQTSEDAFEIILDNSTTGVIGEVKYLVDKLDKLTDDGLNSSDMIFHVIDIVTKTWKLYREIENTLGDFFGKVEFLGDLEKDKLTSLLEFENSNLKFNIKTAVQKLQTRISRGNNDYLGFGLKYTASVKVFGFNLGSLDIEFISSSTNGVGNCSRFTKFSNRLQEKSPARFLGTFSEAVDFGYFFSANKGMGVGGAFGKDNMEAVVQLNAYVTMLGIKIRGDIFINEKGLNVFVEGNLWKVFLVQINVSADSGDDWYKLVFKLKGRFVAKARKRQQVQKHSSSFHASYLDALKKVVTLISDEAKTRITQAHEALKDTRKELSKAQAWLDEKKEVLQKAQGAFDKAMAAFERVNEKLEDAKRKFEEALEKLRNAKRNIDNLCMLEECRMICIPGIKCRICHKKVEFVKMPYPCCRKSSCMISFKDPICLARNLVCKGVRYIAYAALEETKVFVKAPMIAFDVAKVGVSVAQFAVDKSRVVVNQTERVFDFASLGLQGAKELLGVAKGSLEVVKIDVGAAAKVLEFVTEYGVKDIIDVRNCGFNIELSTTDLPIFDVTCEVNAFKLGWKTIRMRINFKNAFQTIWQAAKATIKSIMKQFRGILSERSIDDLSNKATSHMHVLMRHLRESSPDGFNSTSMDNFLNETIDIISEMDGFNSETVNDYDNRVLLFRQKCERIRNVLNFFNSTFEVLHDIVNESVSNIEEIDDVKNLLTEFEVPNIAENMTLEDAGISEENAMNDYDITKEELDQALKNTKSSFMNDSLLVDIANSVDFAKGIIDSEMKSIESINVLSQWILAMENVTKNYFDEIECANFRDCVFHSVSVLYDLYEAEKLPNIDQTRRLISDIEDNILNLFQNTSENVRDIYNTSFLISENINTLGSMNLFCSEAPSFLSNLNSVIAVHGGVARLRCHVTASPEPVYWWFKDTEMLEVEMGETLVIVNVSKTDEGVYRCMAGNVVANVSSNDAPLIVKEAHMKRTDEAKGEAKTKSDLGVTLGATFSVLVGVGAVVSIVVYFVYRRIKSRKMGNRERDMQEGSDAGTKRASTIQYENLIFTRGDIQPYST